MLKADKNIQIEGNLNVSGTEILNTKSGSGFSQGRLPAAQVTSANGT